MLKNPGRPDRKYFAGMPIPAAAGFIAAIVFFADASPVVNVYFSAIWLLAIAGVALLMVSTWRYPSFKQISSTQPRSPLVVIVFGLFIYLIWNWAQIVLLILALSLCFEWDPDSHRRHRFDGDCAGLHPPTHTEPQAGL